MEIYKLYMIIEKASCCFYRKRSPAFGVRYPGDPGKMFAAASLRSNVSLRH
jgi:hypothetical protein